mgnify:CR=1 FL=1
MSIFKSPYEISLWQDRPATFKKLAEDKNKLVENQVIYLKRENGDFYQAFYRGYNSETQQYKYQLANNQADKNRNLIIGGDAAYSGIGYLLRTYNLTEEPVINQEYTVVINGTILDTQKFGLQLIGTGINGYSEKVEDKNNFYIMHFTTPSQGNIPETANLYNYPQGDTSASVNWICLYKGNIEEPALDYIPPVDNDTIYETSTLDFYVEESIIDEEKICVIGSSSATFEGRAISPKLKENINGSAEFTFQLPHRYFNYQTKKWETSDLTSLIFEESKIKLHYKNKWYDFIVKDIQEQKSKSGIFYNYTCTDSFIEELSKQGWSLIFDEENGIGNIHELTEKVLENSGWIYDKENSDSFIETKMEYKTDENGNILFDENTNLPIEEEVEVPLAKNKYEEELSRYVTEYTYDGKPADEECWGYDTTETITVETTRNLLTNSENFIDTVGWEPGDNATIYSKLTKKSDTENLYTLIIKKSVSTQTNPIFYNDTIKSSQYYIKAGQKYAFRIKMNHSNIHLSFNKDAYDGESLFTNNINIPNNIYVIIVSPKAFSRAITTLYSQYSTDCEIESIEFFEIKSRDNTDEQKQFIENLTHGQTVALNTFEENCLIPKDEAVPQVYKEPVTYYYHYDTNGEIEYLDLTDKNPQKIMRTNSEKVRTLKAEKSNRFNLLQDIAELFEGWARFYIKHDDATGKLYRDSITGLPIKTVTFVKEVGSINGTGFQYKQNLIDIQRTRNSDELVTKMYVEKNDTELAENGTVTIEQADSDINISGENFLLNLDYFVQIGMLDARQVINDLYGTSLFDLGYLTNLGRLNKEIDDMSGTRIGLNNTIASLENQVYGLELQISAQKERVSLLQADLGKPITEQQRKETEEALASYNTSISNLEANLKIVQTQLDSYTAQREDINKNIEEKLQKKIDLNSIFNNKYANFIKEGVWQDSNYLTANEYYLDAQKVLYRSCKPQVSYTMNVIDLQGIKGYEDWNFQIGDKTFVIDEDFFGKDSTGAYNKEEVTISEIEYDLDSPQNNKITVQNFKTQFEDLFSRIAAASQTIQFKDGLYTSTANNFTSDGEIKIDILQNTINNNSLILAGSKDQSVTISDRGIELNDLFNTNKIVRLVSGGIFLSQDGGETWTTGITATGINASVLTTGIINTEQIRIMMGSFPSFLWDRSGLTAYRIFNNTNNDGTISASADSNQFVRLDQHGLYMTKVGNQKFADITSDSGYLPWFMNEKLGSWEQRIDYIESNSNVSLTWDGLVVRSDNGSVNISTKGNRITIKNAKKVQDSENWVNETDRVILGYLDSYAVNSYNPDFKTITIGESVYTNGKQIGTFEDEVQLNNLIIENSYNYGDYCLYLGEGISINGTPLENEDIVISQQIREVGNGQISDFIVQHRYILTSKNVYGLTFLDQDSKETLAADDTGRLWIRDGLFIGDQSNEPYFGIEAEGVNLNDKVIWAGPGNIDENNPDEPYVFSVSNNGQLYAQNAIINGNGRFSGYIEATDGIFSGTVYATNGSFNGTIIAQDGYIVNSLGFGELEVDEDGNFIYPYEYIMTQEDGTSITWLLPNSGINGGGKGPLALWINKGVFQVDNSGQLTATSATITGDITIISGLIQDMLKVGDNFTIFGQNTNTENVIEVTNNNGEKKFALSHEGKLVAEEIEIGKDGTISDYLVIGNTGAIINNNDYNNYSLIFGNYENPKISSLKDLLEREKQETDTDDYKNQLIKKYSNFLLDKEGNLTLKGNNHSIEGSVTIQGEGELSIGKIHIGKLGEEDYWQIYCESSPGLSPSWSIDENGNANFENAHISGTLSTTRFEYNEIQTASGTIVIRPSCQIQNIEFDSDSNLYKITLDTPLVSKNGDYFFLQGKTSEIYNQNRLYGFITNVDENDFRIVYTNKLYKEDIQDFNNLTEQNALTQTEFNSETYRNGTFLNMGNDSETGIVLNAMSTQVFTSGQAITFFKNKKILDEEDSNNFYYQRSGVLTLGNLANIPEIQKYIGTNAYGLYSDNVVLNGTFVATSSTAEGNEITAGITTKDDDNVVLWAGAEDFNNKKNSKFYVTNEGEVHAESGYFKGTIISEGGIFSGKISSEGLEIDGQSKGVFFTSDNDDNDNYSNVQSIIDSDGVKLLNGADLRIYKENIVFEKIKTKEEYNALVAKYIPYIFSNDTKKSLNTETLTIHRILPTQEGDSLIGIVIDNQKLLFKKVDSVIDFNNNFENSYNKWYEEAHNCVAIEFKENSQGTSIRGQIDLIDSYNNKKTSIIGDLLENNQINTSELNVSESFVLGTKVVFEPYYEKDDSGKQEQNGFDIYIE